MLAALAGTRSQGEKSIIVLPTTKFDALQVTGSEVTISGI